jgi:hypothetical protein
MRGKLTLNLNDLSVDSFDTTATEKARGTVFGEQCTCYTQCTCPGCPTCANYATCDVSCADTCGDSCGGTCDGYTCNNTRFDYTCNGYGTCGQYPCKIVP